MAKPTGTVTFLFTDIEGSTKLWEHHPEAMQKALARHDALLRQAVEMHGGYVFKTVGDAFYAAFGTAPDALAAALSAQQALRDETWDKTPIKVRMALHTRTADEREGDYFGPPVNRVARLLSAGHSGQILLSSAAQELVRDQLPDQVSLRDLGDHRLKDLTRPERIFQVVVPDLPADFPPLKTLDVRPHNLPAQTTSFIGREAEVAAVVQELARTDVRLLTLTGPGGTGKTRLSLQVAADVLEEFADGVFFVSLAPISDPRLVVSSIVKTLGLQTSGSILPLEVLKTYLQDKQMFLVLDNFEQVLDAAQDINALLMAASHVKVCVTSRIVLRLSGEHEYRVPQLNLPDPKHLPSFQRLTQSEAVQLFADRARAVHPEFTLSEDNAPAVAEICTRLDGLPLAIELAAARVRVLPPEKMLTRLGKPLDFLTGGARDLPARQRTLRNTIEWSYHLLDAEEQILFRGLAVFVGGCTLEAAEAVCPLADHPGINALRVEVLNGLESLVDKNLLTQSEAAGEPRFLMLETIREYAVERLVESGEADTMQQQHAQFFLALAEAIEPKWHTREQLVWLSRFEMDLNNFRAALIWSINNATDVGLRLAGALGHFWDGGAYHQEGREWLAKALMKSRACDTEITRFKAKALNMAGILAWFQGDFTTAYALQEESAALCRMVDDNTGLAEALRWLGVSVYPQDDLARARAFLDESLALCRQIKNTRALAETLHWHGLVASIQHDGEQVRSDAKECIVLAQEAGLINAVASGNLILGHLARDQGEYATAQSFYEKSVKLFQEIAHQQGLPRGLCFLGEVLYAQGHYEQAKTCYQESLERFQKSGNEFTAAWPRQGLGFVSLQQHHWQKAQAYFVESLRVYQKYSSPEFTALCLAGCAGLAEEQGHPERAAQLLGATSILLEALWDTSRFRDPIYQSDYERIIEAVRGALDEEAFEAAWAKGRAMTLEQAIAYALAIQQEDENE
jgi:predicted ATPase/class 3 adenylate cyclase